MGSPHRASGRPRRDALGHHRRLRADAGRRVSVSALDGAGALGGDARRGRGRAHRLCRPVGAAEPSEPLRRALAPRRRVVGRPRGSRRRDHDAPDDGNRRGVVGRVRNGIGRGAHLSCRRGDPRARHRVRLRLGRPPIAGTRLCRRDHRVHRRVLRAGPGLRVPRIGGSRVPSLERSAACRVGTVRSGRGVRQIRQPPAAGRADRDRSDD